MASLRETKDRIGSVRSTLKITSAMKLVASSKLRRAQNAVETLRPYEKALQEILASASSGVRSDVVDKVVADADLDRRELQEGLAEIADSSPVYKSEKVAIVAISSNSSLCGGFNSNVIRKALDLAGSLDRAGFDAGSLDRAGFAGDKTGSATGCLDRVGTAGDGAGSVTGNADRAGFVAGNADRAGSVAGNAGYKADSAAGCAAGSEAKDSKVVVYSLGRKMADAMKKAGYVSPSDYNSMVSRPSYEEIRALADELYDDYEKGRLGRVILVYNHFVSTSKQTVVEEPYIPFERQLDSPGCSMKSEGASELQDYYLYEPDAREIVKELLPRVIALKLFAAVLDSAAAEHAARTVAMQTATDNAQELLGDLTLEYNKGRQQKITAEILDLVGGMQ